MRWHALACKEPPWQVQLDALDAKRKTERRAYYDARLKQARRRIETKRRIAAKLERLRRIIE